MAVHYGGIGELQLGLKPISWAILHLLSERTPKFAPYVKSEHGGFYNVELVTRPWYNCRETGFGIVMKHPNHYGKNMLPKNNPKRVEGNDAFIVVVWSENRSSDDIVVQFAIVDEMDDTFNQVFTNDIFIDEDWKQRRYVKPGDLHEAVNVIYERLEWFYNLPNDEVKSILAARSPIPSLL